MPLHNYALQKVIFTSYLVGLKVYAQYNLESKVTVISYTMVKDLCILVIQFQATFRQAAGAKRVY